MSYGRNYTLTGSPPASGEAIDELTSSAGVEDISILDRDRWVALEPELLALYQQEYGRFGGGRKRSPGYWDMILDSHVYRERRWWLVVLWPNQEHLAGYLVAVQGLASPSKEVYVYEVVGENEDAVERLIRYARGLPPNERGDGQSANMFAKQSDVVVPNLSLPNPACAVLRRMGFVERKSTSHIMARILRPDRIFRRLADGSDLLHTLSLAVVTPHRTLVVNDPASEHVRQSRYTVQIETKESLLSRLFCCRLDLGAAVEMELIRWNVYDPGLKRELERVFAFSEWVQWFTDYV